MVSVDTSRAPRSELGAAKLVDAVVANDDRIERHYLEVKSTLDLTTKKDQAKLAKFILGAANRMPARAAEAFEGYGVMVIGASKDAKVGIPPIEALDIENAVLPFIGADGPRYDFVRVPVNASDNEVLVLLVDPPKMGQPPYICRKNGDGGLRDGAWFVRADGATREANHKEQEQLIERGRVTAPKVLVNVRVVGLVYPVVIDPVRTVKEYISVHTFRLREALAKTKRPRDPDAPARRTNASSAIERAIGETRRQAADAVLRSMGTSSPEKRSENAYLESIDEWEQSVLDGWPTAVNRLVGVLGRPSELEITNLENTFLNDVEVRVQLDRGVHGTKYRGADSEQVTLDALGIPDPPRRWGPWTGLDYSRREARISDLLSGLSLSQVAPARTRWRNTESVDWEFELARLRPKGRDISEDEDLVLYVTDSSRTAISGTWQVTARDHHDVYTGTLDVQLAEPIDLTAAFRTLLGLDSK